MKKEIKIPFILTCITIGLAMFFVIVFALRHQTVSKEDLCCQKDIELIHQFTAAVNDKNIDAYIPLFCTDIQTEMYSFLEMNGNDNFFLGEKRELLSVSKLKTSYIKEHAELFDDVSASFNEFCVYYVIERLSFPKESIQKQNLVSSNLYIIVRENNEQKLFRISATPEIDESYLECDFFFSALSPPLFIFGFGV